MNDKNNTLDWTEWLMTNRRMVAASCIALLIVIIGGVWMLQSRSGRQFKDFETADILAEDLQKSNQPLEGGDASQSQQQMLTQLKELTDSYSLLQPRFDSLIAQEMLLQGNTKELDPYAKRSVERLKALGLTDFAAFSEVSRLTGLENYKEALKKALELKESLAAKKQDANAKPQYVLEGFLLLHIASLNQKLEQQEAMLQSVIELKEHLGLIKRQKPLTRQERELASDMLAFLQDREESLLEYMQEVPTSTDA